MELIKILLLAHSNATALVKRRTPPLLAQYADAVGLAAIPEAEDIFTMRPPPVFCIAETAYLVPRKTPSRLTAMMWRHSLSDMSVTGFAKDMPALLIK